MRGLTSIVFRFVKTDEFSSAGLYLSLHILFLPVAFLAAAHLLVFRRFRLFAILLLILSCAAWFSLFYQIARDL